MESLGRVEVTQTSVWRWLKVIAVMAAFVAANVLAVGLEKGLVVGLPISGLVLLLQFVLFPTADAHEVRIDGGLLRIGDRVIERDDADVVAIDPYPPHLRLELPNETITIDVPHDGAERIKAMFEGPRRPQKRRAFVVQSRLTGGGMVRTELTIGSDGVFLRSASASRFVPRAEIVRLEPSRLLIDGGAIEFRAPRRERPALRHAFADLCGEATEASSAIVEPHSLDASTPAEWVAAIRRAEPAYRIAPIDDATRWSVAADAVASPEQRAAAAIAIGGDEESRKRVRVIADAVANPELQAVLDAVAEDDEGALLAAVAALSRFSGS
jgi:hypothetical protein